MVVVPVETVVETLGIHYIEQHLNFIADFQVVLHFVDKMMDNPGEYTHYDYLEFRGEHLMRFRTAFIDKIRKSKKPQGSNRTQRLSPHGRYFGPGRFESHSSPRSSQVPPDVSNMSNRHSSNSHPNFIAQSGSDVEEELSESASQAEARKQVEEMEAEEFFQDQGDQAWYHRVRYGKTPSVKSYQGSVRSKRKEDYIRKDSPPKTRSNVSSNKIQWDGKRSTYPAFQADLEGTMLRLGMGYLVDTEVMEAYAKEGMDFIESDPFWAEFGISVKQFKYDI